MADYDPDTIASLVARYDAALSRTPVWLPDITAILADIGLLLTKALGGTTRRGPFRGLDVSMIECATIEPATQPAPLSRAFRADPPTRPTDPQRVPSGDGVVPSRAAFARLSLSQ